MITLREQLKTDLAVTPGAINATAATGPYFDLTGHDSAIFVLTTGAVAAAATAIVQIMGNDVAGSTGAAVITNFAATVTGASKATIAQIVHGSPTNGNTVTINGVVFTDAAATDNDENEFASAADLTAQINAALPGLTATDAAGTITIVSKNPGAEVITIASTGSALVPSTIAATAFVEVPAGIKRWVAARVTTSANITAEVTVVRGHARNLPVVHAVAGQYPV